jgi:hypothetical protein
VVELGACRQGAWRHRHARWWFTADNGAATELGFRVIGGGRSSPMIEEVMGAVP